VEAEEVHPFLARITVVKDKVWWRGKINYCVSTSTFPHCVTKNETSQTKLRACSAARKFPIPKTNVFVLIVFFDAIAVGVQLEFEFASE